MLDKQTIKKKIIWSIILLAIAFYFSQNQSFMNWLITTYNKINAMRFR